MGYYRYGFNGKEKDQNGEWGEHTTNYDYGFRIYNPAIAKFLSVDPLTKSYAELTPYQFASNTPIAAVDLDGLESRIIIKMLSGKKTSTHELSKGDYTNNEWHSVLNSMRMMTRDAKFSEGSNDRVGGQTSGDMTIVMYRNKGKLAMAAHMSQLSTHDKKKYNPIPFSQEFAESFNMGAHAAYVFFVKPDPLVARSAEFKRAFDNYLNIFGAALSGGSIVGSSSKGLQILSKTIEALEILSDLDDGSGGFDEKGRTALEKAGIDKGTIEMVKIGINTVGTAKGFLEITSILAKSKGKLLDRMPASLEDKTIKSSVGTFIDEKTAMEKSNNQNEK